MIRLGSLGGYPFEGPRVLAGWNPPARPGVFAILMRPRADAKPNEFAVIYVGASEDLSKEGFPFKHRHADFLGCTRVDSGFVNDEVALFECMAHGGAGLDQWRHVRAVGVVHWCGHGDDEDLRYF